MIVKGKIWIETDFGLKIGLGRALLLDRINTLGSISEAARELKIPYRRAWGIIRDMNENSPKQIVLKEVGGKSGGKSELTDYGKRIVELFNEVDDCFKKFSKSESDRFSGWEEF